MQQKKNYISKGTIIETAEVNVAAESPKRLRENIYDPTAIFREGTVVNL